MKNNILDISTHALDLSTDLVNAPDAIEFGIPCELARLLVKDLGELDDGVKLGPFWKESEADEWVDESHTKVPLYY